MSFGTGGRVLFREVSSIQRCPYRGVPLYLDLEEELEKAKDYENRCDGFDRWLGAAESKLQSWQPLPIASQPLVTQEQEMKVSRTSQYNGT